MGWDEMHIASDPQALGVGRYEIPYRPTPDSLPFFLYQDCQTV